MVENDLRKQNIYLVGRLIGSKGHNGQRFLTLKDFLSVISVKNYKKEILLS